jgi:uncharacterized membrane protein
MEQIFIWAHAHQAITGLISFVLAIGLVAVPNDVVIKAGFTVSQMVRKLLGEKVEKAIQEKAKAFEQGMESDDKK